MDHSFARIMEFSTLPMETKTINSKFTQHEKDVSLAKGESHLNTKEQHHQAEYYKELSEVIRNYDDVLLFGQTDAKLELMNILKPNHLFEKINFEVISTDKMTENEQQIFVREHFLKT